jgi:hypothetical protein
MKKNTLILIIFIVVYLWLELAVGVFFQDSWGGS